LADRGRLTANLAAVGLLVAVAAGVLLWQRPWQAPDKVAAAIPEDARALLGRQFGELSDATSRREFVAAAGDSPAARAFAGRMWDDRRRVGATMVQFTYKQGGEAADRADGSTSARVKVSWRPTVDSVFAGSMRATATVRFRLLPRRGGFDVVSASSVGSSRLPIWLAGPVRLDRKGSVSVLTLGNSRGCVDVGRFAHRAVEAVRKVQSAAAADLVVVCPRSAGDAAALLGRRAADIAQIAAISTSLGGPRGIPAVVLNPRMFATMDKRARQVIASHEATHVLTGVIGRRPTPWVAEGYADFVALHDDNKPLSVKAGQILSRVRVSGPPKSLPSAKDFDERAQGLGAAYESAWMAFRLLAGRFGDPAVTGFYQDVVAGTPVTVALPDHFGMSLADFTSAWRDYLTKSASTAS
jgi:hypothetical protein